MPARSQAQQRFMGMVHAEKEGKLDKSKLDPEFAAKIERIAASIKAKAAREYAETKHKDLPKKVKKKGITKKASAYLKMLRMALKAAPKTTKTVAPAAKAVAPKVDDVVFNVKPLGSGHYNAYLGKNPIGGMSVNPVTKAVDDVLINKAYRKKGYGTKLYEKVLQHEGGLVMNENTVSPGAQAIWKNLSRKYPTMHGGKGVKWVEKNIIKEGSEKQLSEQDTLVAPQLKIKDSDNVMFWKKEVMDKPTFKVSPKTVLQHAYNATDEEFKDIVSKAKKKQKEHPDMRTLDTTLGYLSDQDLVSPQFAAKQILTDKNLNKKVGVRVVPGSDMIAPKGGLADAYGAAIRGGTSVAIGNKKYDHTLSKKDGRVTLPHELRHSIQDPEAPKARDVRGRRWVDKPQEVQAGAGHIKQEYFRHTKAKTGKGVIVDSPETASDALKWYEQEGKKEQYHEGSRQWLRDPKYRKALKLYMPFTVDKDKTPKKFKGKYMEEPQTKLASKKRKKKKRSELTNAVMVGLTGAGSVAIPFAPLHAGVAAERAPKGKKTKASASAVGYGLAGSVPGMAYQYAQTMKATKKDRALHSKKKISTKELAKRTGKAALKVKRLGPAIGLMAVGQGLGAGYGYYKAVKNKKS